jgi:2-dehydro-3-deoxyphosphooctonate aldolase (KDO 8-P synthase)
MSAQLTSRIGPVTFGGGKLALIAGPCAAESLDLCLRVAERMTDICARLGIGYVFKASYDKANRTSLDNPRGPGMAAGLDWLAQVRQRFGAPVLSDVHDVAQAGLAGAVLDCLQIPAFLCRQTDLLLAAGRTGKAVNIKKGQFLAPAKMRYAVDKIRAVGNPNVLVTERGTTFGYDSLVNDFRCVPVMKAFAPVVFDATHSIQSPGGGEVTGGQRQYVPTLCYAALAAGADALFIETHPTPEQALSDAQSQWPLGDMEELLKRCLDIYVAASHT